MVGALAAAGLLAYVLADRTDDFLVAVRTASLGALAVSAVLQAAALVARTEAWHVCVAAAGSQAGRRPLYWASSLGALGSQLNAQVGTAARIAVLRRTAAVDAPRVPALVAAEVPIVVAELALAAITSFTIVGPLGLPWWVPPAGLAAAGCVVAVLQRLAGRQRHARWMAGLAALRTIRSQWSVLIFVVVAAGAQVARNWAMLTAVGLEVSFFDAIAVLISVSVLAQLPMGPSVGAAAVVAILGRQGLAPAAAAGVLLTATGTVGALGFTAWGVVDRFLHRSARTR
jgi:hypothetical protein